MHDTDATALIQTSMPFCATLGIQAESLAAEEVVLTLDWTAETCTTAGMMHGRAMMALADSAGAMCAFANLPEGAAGTSTIESKTNFLGVVREGRARAVSRPLHTGRTTIVVETEIRVADKLVAKVTQTQAVLRP